MNNALARLAQSTIATVAGAGLRDGIPARDADAGWPLGVVRRPDGDLIVADYHANILWRIDGDGILHRFAGGRRARQLRRRRPRYRCPP